MRSAFTRIFAKKPRTVDAMVRDAPAAPARARLARTRTTHSPTPYLTSGERSSQTKSTVHNCHDRRARHHRLHPIPQASPSTYRPPPKSTGTAQNFHGTRSSDQQQDSEQKIRSPKLPRCCRMPEPAADAQHRRRRRRHRLARTISTGLWATSRPPRVPGWRRRLPHESPTPSGPSPGRNASLHAPIAAPCLMLLDACDRSLDLVVGSCLLQYLTPQIMSHDAIHTHTRTHTHTHAGSIIALTYTTIRNTGRTLASSVFGSRTLGTPRLKHHYIDQHIGHTQMKVGQ